MSLTFRGESEKKSHSLKGSLRASAGPFFKGEESACPERGLSERNFILREACPSEASFIMGTPYWSWGRSFPCAPGGGRLQSTFLTAFSGDFGPLGGVTHFPASRQAYMECFEGGRGVFSRVPPVGPWDYSMSQTQNPGNPGVLRYIPDQTGGFSGPKKSRKNPGPGRAGPGRAGRAGPGWAGLGRAGPGRAGPGHAESAGKIFSWPRKNIFGSKKMSLDWTQFYPGIIFWEVFRGFYPRKMHF